MMRIMLLTKHYIMRKYLGNYFWKLLAPGCCSINGPIVKVIMFPEEIPSEKSGEQKKKR